MYNLYLNDNAKIFVSEDFSPAPFLAMNGQQYIRQISGINNLKCLDWFSDSTTGESNINQLVRQWRLSLDGNNWTDWFTFEETQYNVDYNTDTYYQETGSVKLDNDPPTKKLAFAGVDFTQLDTSLTYFIEISWTKNSTLPTVITIDSYEFMGCWDRQTSYNPINTLVGGDYLYVRPVALLKVFKLTGVEIEADGITPNRSLSIDFRFSQDSGKTWTGWQPLNNSNIATLKFSRVRFFLPEYRILRTGDISGSIMLYNINLLGDVQNVGADYLMSNSLGIRDCCCIVDANGNTLQNITNNIDLTGGGTGSQNGSGGQSNLLQGLNNCNLPSIYQNPLSSENLSNLFSPYNLDKAVSLYSALSTITTQIFGFTVTYFATDADANGQDHTFHEYQLFNIACVSDIKVSVNDNEFPDNQISFNAYDMSLFESFEISITKEAFHSAFGISRRPSQEDILWFCELNRMYQVEHSQVKRDFNNSGVYYRVILKKYNQKSNVKPGNSTIEERINALKRNSTLDELMGKEMRDDKERVVNKTQLRTLTHNRVRDMVYATMVKEYIDNSTLVVSKQHYDLGSITYSDIAVVYNSDDKKLEYSNNRAITVWFNVNNFYNVLKEVQPSNIIYTYVTQSINFIDNYDEFSGYGYSVNLNNTNSFDVRLNSLTFSMPVTGVTDSVWYCYLVNIDQKLGVVSQYLYTRNAITDFDAMRLRSPELKLISYTASKADNQQFEIDYDLNIKASDTKLTNIRIYSDIILPEFHSKVLNQNIVKDHQYLILADNANTIMKAPNNFPYN